MKTILLILLFLSVSFSVTAGEAPLELKGFEGYWEWSRNDPPQYPRKAYRSGITGHVSVFYTINSKGRIEDVKIVESQPEGVFDKATLKALKKVRFRPSKSNQNRQPVRVPFTMKFRVS
ncbi:MAG: TonB family protein [Lysobacterales bacterium]